MSAAIWPYNDTGHNEFYPGDDEVWFDPNQAIDPDCPFWQPLPEPEPTDWNLYGEWIEWLLGDEILPLAEAA